MNRSRVLNSRPAMAAYDKQTSDLKFDKDNIVYAGKIIFLSRFVILKHLFII